MATPPAAAGAWPIAELPVVLAALQDPIRLEMVRRLGNAGTAMRCATLYDTINKSTAAHHFKILREAGIIERTVVDGHPGQQLRSEDLDTTVPGLLKSIIAAANRDSDQGTAA